MSEAEEVWNKLFPSAQKVHFNAFLTIFENYFRLNFPLNCQPNISFQRILKHSIVLNDNIFVTKKNFENFLKLFGPLRLSLVKVCSNLFDSSGILNPWFHGSLSREQSSIILKTLSEGHYLVRLSETQPGNFTIVYVANDNKPKNVLVYNYQECGYGLDQNRENCGEGRTFDNLPAFIALHSAKLRYPIQSPLYTNCVNEGPSLNTNLISQQIPKPIGSPNSFSPSQQQQQQQQGQYDEDPYGTFSLNIQTQNLTLNPQIVPNVPTRSFITPTNIPQTPAPSFDDMENPYGYFGMDTTTTTPPMSSNNHHNGNINSSPFQTTSRSILYPQISPKQLGIQSGSSQTFNFQSTPSSSLSSSSGVGLGLGLGGISDSQLSTKQDSGMEDNYGYFNPDAISMPNEIQRLVSHDQILSITSTDGTQVDLPFCSRASSDPVAKSSSNNGNDLFLHPMKLHQNTSYRILSTNGQHFPQINRSELSCLLDESSHRGREGKHIEALEITTLVDQEIRNYIENVKRLQDSKNSENMNGDKRSERSSSTDIDISEITNWIPPAISTEDLRLLAKTLAQKGDIQKAMGAEVNVYHAAYQESHDVLQTLFQRLERSDRGYFEDMQSFGRIHRKLAMIYFTEKRYDLAEYHFAEELGMMLLDCDITSRNHAVRNLAELKLLTPEFAISGTEKESQNLLNQGIAAFNKGLQGYSSAAELLTKSIRNSRLCGSLMTELRALGNLATVESTRGNQYEAIRYYTQCVILCRHLNDTTTLKKILYKQVTCFMNVALYNKALSCIDQLMIIATSLQNIEKLEDLKQRARKQLVARTNITK